MTARRRPRTGTRRDGQVRSIRTDTVRYPGCDHPACEPLDSDTERELGRSLRPARDAGVSISGRLTRERRLRTLERRRRNVGVVTALIVLSLLGIGWRYTSDREAARTPFAGSNTQSGPITSRTTTGDRNVAQIRAIDSTEEPTPIFASARSVTLRLPVRTEDLTEIGFHQASYGYALRMETLMPRADMRRAKKDRSTHRDLSKQPTGPSATLTGSVLVMWRNRPGTPDTAVDVGAKAGSPVFAPVSGTVVKVKRYKLYGQHDDLEIHIQPTGMPELDCVLIHIDDLAVQPGDVVIAGVTRIGVIRKLSDRVTHQLGEYTRDGGDHTHIQINDATHDDYRGLKGAFVVGSGS